MQPLLPGEWTKIISAASGDRLDVYLAKNCELSRARIQKLVAEGRVLYKGETAKSNQLLETGDEISVFLPPAKSSPLEAQNIPLELLYQDAELAVIEKPAGLVVHPAAGHEDGTLVNALLHHFTDLSKGSGIGGELRPGIVHRIDRNTSGILLITKTDRAHHSLSLQFKEHSISRRYTGLCWGKLPAAGEWKGAIGRDPKDRKKMAIVESGRSALTKFRLLERFHEAVTLFEAELFTGRTHQIRVHFSSAGFPLVGDSVYEGGKGKQATEAGLKILAKQAPGAHSRAVSLRAAERQFLHASHLGFVHPVSQERMEFNSPLPGDLAGLVLSLKG